MWRYRQKRGGRRGRNRRIGVSALLADRPDRAGPDERRDSPDQMEWMVQTEHVEWPRPRGLVSWTRAGGHSWRGVLVRKKNETAFG